MGIKKVIKSNKKINVLGVIFDSKLQWADHIAHAITKLLNALNAIRLKFLFAALL